MNINVGIDLPLGLGSHRQRVDYLYRTTTPLFAYLTPWGGEHVLVIRDGHILGVVLIDSNRLREPNAAISTANTSQSGQPLPSGR